jgi:hypothetical protein
MLFKSPDVGVGYDNFVKGVAAYVQHTSALGSSYSNHISASASSSFHAARRSSSPSTTFQATSGTIVTSGKTADVKNDDEEKGRHKGICINVYKCLCILLFICSSHVYIKLNIHSLTHSLTYCFLFICSHIICIYMDA